MIRVTRRNVALGCTALLLACGTGTDETAEDQAEPAATTGEPASSLAAFAGAWSVRATNEAGDSLTVYELTATDQREGWLLTFPGRDPLLVRVLDAAGDSVVIEIGPYESILRPGVQVSATIVSRVQGDQSTGRFTARYVGAGADSILHGLETGTRIR